VLDLETRQEVLGITVFQDADAPNQYYYLPAQPHISRDAGGAMFDLYAYRKGGLAGQTESGGFLTMTVDVGLEGLAERIVTKLKDQTGRDDITIAAVPFSKGSVRVVALGEDSTAMSAAAAGATAPTGGPLVAHGPRFIENILGATTPSLDALNRAIFSLSLSEDGAAFFIGALKGAPDARIVGVIYDLEYIGLLPAYDLEIEIDFKSSYNFVRSLFTLNTLFFKAEVDNVVEQLKREQHIKIKETARTLALSTPEAIQARQAHIDQVVKDLATGALFAPALIPGQPRNTDPLVTATDPTAAIPMTGVVSTPAGAAASSDSQGLMAAVAQGPSVGAAAGQSAAFRNSVPNANQTASGGGTQAGTSGSTPAPGGGTAAALGGTGGSGSSSAPTTSGGTQPAASTSGGAQPGGTTPAATTSGGGGGTAAQPATAADVWNRLGRPQAAYAMRSISQEEQRTVKYSLTQVTAQKQTVAPQSFIRFLGSAAELEKRVHEVDLNNPFFARLNLNVNAADINFEADGIEQVTVQLRYGTRPDGSAPKDTAEVILRKNTDSLDVTFFADGHQTQSYEYKLIADFRSDFGIGVKEPRVEGPWTTTEARSLAVHPGWLGQILPLTVEMAPNVGEGIAEIQAVVHYARPDRGIDESRLLHLRGDARSQALPIRLVADGDQIQVTPTVFYADGSKEQLAAINVPDPAAGQPTSSCILSVPRGDFLVGDMLMLDSLGELSSVIVDTEVRQHSDVVDSRSTELNQAGVRKTFAVRLPDRSTPPVLQFKERRLYRDGGLEDLDWRRASAANLVVGIPGEGVGSVAVKYMGPPPTQLGVAALELDLEYADPEGDDRFHQLKTLLIDDTPASWTQDWKFRLVHRDARTYSWTLTLLRADGSSFAGPVMTDQRSVLVLRVPQA
jgi:hypothetical protein